MKTALILGGGVIGGYLLLAYMRNQDYATASAPCNSGAGGTPTAAAIAGCPTFAAAQAKWAWLPTFNFL